MRFASEDDAWQHWMALYEFHGKYEGIGRNEAEQMEMFKDWMEDNDVSILDYSLEWEAL